ncbi:Teichoic acid translocation permease protein TagG [compost metagenome]
MFSKERVLYLWRHRELIRQFTIRDLASRYKGSYLGFLWSFLYPIMMLVVYTFVYSEIFKSRWTAQSDSKIEFALIIFAGLTTYNIFSEVVSRAPSLIIQNVNYVKKVVFPLEILPVSVLGSALINSLFSFSILITSLITLQGKIYWTALFLPLVLLPLLLLSVGLAWILSSIGVYFRDISQVVTVAVQALMLLSPIFYSTAIIPDDFKFIYHYNIIGFVIEDMRNILIFGLMPDWANFTTSTTVGAVILLAGYICFKKLKGGFADVM